LKFGNVVLEAMASGVPAIVTREGGPKYLVRPSENGELASRSAERFSGDAVWKEVYRRQWPVREFSARCGCTF
jgi:glycosyltransferase involved in cell wall biosynthesis